MSASAYTAPGAPHDRRQELIVPRSFRLAFAIVLLAGASLTRGHAADRPHLAVAIEAATWIRASAITTSQGLTWPANPLDPSTVGASLYSGAPGVVLFLLDLHRATGTASYLADARAGADDLLARVGDMAESGLYTGIAGVGFTLLETSRVTRDAKYRDGAARVVAMLATRARTVDAGVEWNDTTDIIGGSAGIGLFLLRAAVDLDDARARDLAARAGRRLLALGTAAEGGTKWAMTPSFSRLMPNFSHGTAGVAYFLATLYQATNERAFLDGALAGARYVQAIAKTEGDMCLVFHHEPGDEGRNLFYLGWCHGPAGTARLWYRLWQATGDTAWLTWARKSARALLASGIHDHETAGFWNNVGQCCGSAGVAEFALEMHRATRDAEYLAFARTMTKQLLSKATRDARGARWIHAENRSDPAKVVAQTGWMQGAAGVGAWLLRLDAFERGAPADLTRLPDSPF